MAQLLRLARLAERSAHTGRDAAEALGTDAPSNAGRRRVLQGAAAGMVASGAGVLAPPMAAAAAAGGRSLLARFGLFGNGGVAVVGAGIAGLACATELARNGVATHVFEAGSRVGGRCWSVRRTFPGQVGELGAEFIGTSHHAMLGYARSLGLRLEPIDAPEGVAVHHFQGRRYTEAQVLEEFRAFAAVIGDDLQALGAPTADRFSAQDELFDFMTLSEYLDLYGAGGLLRSVVQNAYLAEFGAGIDEVSAISFLRFVYGDRRSHLGPGAGGSLRVAGGNDLIPRGLAGRLKQPVRLGHTLVAVRRLSGGRVRLTFDTSGGATVQSDHDAVVLALPFSVLRDVVFDASTELPQWKHDAIARSSLGEGTRMLLGFREPFWRRGGANGTGAADLPSMQTTWEANPSAATGAGAVLAHQAGGAAARALLPANVQSDAADFLASLEEAMPGAIAAASRTRSGALVALTENWGLNPLSRGAVPCPRPGYFTTIAHHEAKPVGNLLFAGDHTSSFYEWQGFMEGAALSGLRAAAEAAQLLRTA